MKFYVIGDDETVTGFSMVGVRGRVVSTGEDTAKALKDAVTSGDFGVIFITERLARWVRSEIDSISMKGTFPLILEIPDRGGPLKERSNIRDIVQKAVGVNV